MYRRANHANDVYPPSKLPLDIDGTDGDGIIHYKYRGIDQEQSDNRALWMAMSERLPLAYFYSIAKWPYLAFSPIFSIREFPKHHEFIVGLEESFSVTNPIPKESLDRGYMNRLTKARIHQPVFRGGVINASETSCAICRVHHPDLLDAAHIIPDSRE